MARLRKPAIVLSFTKTTDAMAVEKYCMAHNLPGRLIPIPREITAGCGLAWKAAPEDEELLVSSLKEDGLPWSGLYHMEL
ncbi:MAG: DUF3343 domain-containing protein [Lachnospiraceae bacterium]|nr:DUF3343 domain-containing protein [Candidatus Equihabitans merdae]